MKKFFRFIIIFLVVSGWIFSGWPRIWNNPKIPPEIKEAQAVIGGPYTAGSNAAVTASAGDNNGFETTPTNTTANDAAYAISASSGTAASTACSLPNTSSDQHDFGTFNITNITANSIINGITVTLDANYSSATGVNTLCAFLSWDGGTTWTAGKNTPDINASDVTNALGGAADNWGRTWSVTELNNTNFKVRVMTLVSNTARTANLDYLAVNVDYTAPATYLGNDTDPGVNPTIAPGAATTTVGTFNLRTNTGTDTVTNATTTLSAGSSAGLFGVEITNSASTTVCSVYNPSSDTVGLTGCNLPVTTASSTFYIGIKPKSHGAMPAPPGSTYSVTATITAITATNPTSGSDTTSDTVTIDNASPNGATSVSGTAGGAKVTLNWTTSNSSDFDTTSGSVILRWAAASAGSEVPTEGKSDYAAGNTISTATVACVISSAGSSAQTKIDGSGGDTGCTTAALTNGQQYTYVAFQRDTNGNYDAGVSIGTFTPVAVSLTFTIDTGSVSFVSTLTPGTPVSTSSVLTVNTNSPSGYNITLARASTTPTLFLTADTSTTIADNPNGNNWTAPATSSASGPSAVWTGGTTKGLGFRLKQTGTVTNTYSTAWWGADDTSGNALYSGISTSTAAQIIAKSVWAGSASNENTVVEYKIDVASNQKSGSYTSSPITFTALPN